MSDANWEKNQRLRYISANMKMVRLFFEPLGKFEVVDHDITDKLIAKARVFVSGLEAVREFRHKILYEMD